MYDTTGVHSPHRGSDILGHPGSSDLSWKSLSEARNIFNCIQQDAIRHLLLIPHGPGNHIPDTFTWIHYCSSIASRLSDTVLCAAYLKGERGERCAGCESARTTRARRRAGRGSNAGILSSPHARIMGEVGNGVAGPASPCHPPDPAVPSDPEIHSDTPADAEPPRVGAGRREENGDLLKGNLGSGDWPEERDGDSPRARPAGRWRTRADLTSCSAEDSTTGRACRTLGRNAAPRGCGVRRRG